MRGRLRRRQERGLRAGLWSIAAALTLASLLAGGEAPQPETKPPVYRLRVHADATGLASISAAGLDVAGRDLAAGWVEVIADAQELSWLTGHGLEVELLERRDSPRPLASASGPGTEQVDPGYSDPAGLEAYLIQVAADHPQITRLEVIGTSIEGRAILAMMISDNAAEDEDEPAILFSAEHHAREVMTVEVVKDIIERLTDGYGSDPATTARVDGHEIWCVPAANPDGLNLVFTQDDLWRKNARDNDGNGRINWKDGVDTNRNYDWGWGDQCLGSSGTAAAATYRGTAPSSEPETRALTELGRRIRPVFDVEFHSYGEDVFYALGCDPQFSPTLDTITGADASVARVVAEQYAARLIQADGAPGFLAAPYGDRVDGVGRDQQAHEQGAIAFVTELNSAAEGGFQPSFDAYRDATVEGQRPGWEWLIDRVSGPAIGGHVVDATTGLPVGADLALDEMHLPDGRRLTADATTGRFHLIVVPGQYTLRVRAPGYSEAVVPIDVGAAWEPRVVALQPDGSTTLARFTFEDAVEAATWTVGAADDDATAGLWEWGVPSGTHSGDVPSGTLEHGAPALDRTPGEGARAFVTGNAPGADIDDDDVERGTTTLVSPPLDLAGRYAVELVWQQWLRTEAEDPLDGLTLELSSDGESWVPAGGWFASSASEGGAPSWVERRVRLDDLLAPGAAIQLRFRAFDTGARNIVEAAVDDLELTGYSLAQQGRVAGLGFAGDDRMSLLWQPVPGASDATYLLARGELGDLGRDGVDVQLGPLTCLGGVGPGVTQLVDPATPAPGSGWFYVVRFALGYSQGDWGTASDGALRVGDTDCLP